jgi:hypothetical protein
MENDLTFKYEGTPIPYAITGSKFRTQDDPELATILPNDQRCEQFGVTVGKKTSTLPDSGKRREFDTGSVRDIRTGKGRYDLISPIALKALAIRLEDGMSKYEERNWEKGQPLMSYLDSAMRHIQTYIANCMLSKYHEEDHMGAALWNIHSFIHTKFMIDSGCLPQELNDLPQNLSCKENNNGKKKTNGKSDDT